MKLENFNTSKKLIDLILRVRMLSKDDPRSEKGYAMLIVSMISIVLLSLLAAAMTLSNLTKARTDAFVDSSSAFHVAEAGLNKRAFEFKTKLETYSGVTEVAALGESQGVNACFGIQTSAILVGTDQLGCRNYDFTSKNNLSTVVAPGGISLSDNSLDKAINKYIAYTSISKKPPSSIVIPTTDDYAGLNAIEYKYVVQSIAKKPVFDGSRSATAILPTAAESAAIDRASNPHTDDEEISGNHQAQIASDALLIAAYNARREAAAITAGAAEKSSVNVDLSMTFVNRVIPLFQFGIFYNGDLELNSTSPMPIKGWVHSNANIYVQPAGLELSPERSITTFLSKVSAVGDIYNRVDAWEPGIGRTGITRVLLTGDACATSTAAPSNCQDFASYNSAYVDPLVLSPLVGGTATDLFPDKKVQDRHNQTVYLKTPSPSFGRKRNYSDNQIGRYFSHADMRLEFFPDRDVTDRSDTSSFIRDEKNIPFNFLSIKTGGTATDTCTTTPPVAGVDPDSNYIDPKRENATNLKCHAFTKGQLQSLRQPVVVLTGINQSNAGLRASESIALGAPTNLAAIARPGLSVSANTDINKKKIVRALQIALASFPSPIHLENLEIPLDEQIYSTSLNGALGGFRDSFSDLLDRMGAELNQDDRDNLLKARPTEIVALLDGWFLPAPIQRIERPTADTDTTDKTDYPNPRRSGFYDGRERRWITMLQTNIASLSVWNRDGLFVDSIDETSTTAYESTTTLRQTVFGVVNIADAASTTNASSTNGLAFDRAITAPTGSTAKGLQVFGLGNFDRTEGGLVIHATVSDNLDGDSVKNILSLSSTINDVDDVTLDTANPIYKKNADNTNFEDVNLPASVTDRRVIIDFNRKYPGVTTETKKSPFGFAFNGGNYLPNALTISSDQSIYVQGNFNNNASNNLANQPNYSANTPSPDRLPASIVADTITVLSNECVIARTDSSNNFLSMPLGQLKCGLPPSINGTPAVYDPVSSAMAVNAAFLSNTPVSNGNKGTGRYDGTPENRSYSGGANNYIRLLEDWNNNDNAYSLNYHGSLISLGVPMEYSGQYKAGGGNPEDFPYYNVPFRNINYDPFFGSIEKLPPFTPKASYVQQKNFNRAH